jgi:hypothetical protein
MQKFTSFTLTEFKKIISVFIVIQFVEYSPINHIHKNIVFTII